MSLAEKLQTFSVEFMKGARLYVRLKWVKLAYWSGIVFWLCRKFKRAEFSYDSGTKTLAMKNGYGNVADLKSFVVKNGLYQFLNMSGGLEIPSGYTLHFGKAFVEFDKKARVTTYDENGNPVNE